MTGLLDISSNPTVENLLSLEEQKEEIENAKRFIKNRYPNVDFKKLGPIVYSKKTPLELVVLGPKGGESPLFLKNGSDLVQSALNKTFIKNALGPRGDEIITKASEDIRKKQKELTEKRQSQARFFEIKEAKEKEELELKRRLELEAAKKSQLEDDPNSDKQEIKRKDQLIKNLEKDLKAKQKENNQLQKNYEDSKKKTEKIGQLETSIADEEQKRNLLERRFNSTRSFDALKEQESHLIRQNEEDQAIINDQNAVSFDKEAAEERVAARNQELARLQTQIVEREEAMPLRERVKEIFKKNGVTVTAILLAAGVTIGAVMSALTKGLKATGKAMANGLKEIAAKLGSLLPGLIGQIATFLFKTAANAVGFLAEHTWLIILAVVAFLFEKYIKKRR